MCTHMHSLEEHVHTGQKCMKVRGVQYTGVRSLTSNAHVSLYSLYDSGDTMGSLMGLELRSEKFLFPQIPCSCL